MGDKCPMCERGFESWRDYPIIYISEFNRTEIPEFIEDQNLTSLHVEAQPGKFTGKLIPEEVIRLLKDKSIVSYNGILYREITNSVNSQRRVLRASRDITKQVKEAITKPIVRETLSKIEELVGSEVCTGELLSLPGFEERMEVAGYNDVSLNMSEYGSTNKFKCFSVCLVGGWEGGHIQSAAVSQNLAEISYKGRVNN